VLLHCSEQNRKKLFLLQELTTLAVNMLNNRTD